MIEVAVAGFLSYRRHTIVPNISHGLFNHECDLLVLDSKKRFTEIEIKVSLADLKRDFNKGKFAAKSWNDKYISRLIYAVPEKILEKAKDIIPSTYGIISVKEYYPRPEYTVPVLICRWERMVKHDKTSEPAPPSVLDNFYRLGCMRIWDLKRHNNRTKV